MFIEFTTVIGCRNNCSYCPQTKLVHSYFSSSPRRPQILTLQNFKKILHQIPQNIEINFSGFSEPFQNSDCTDMIIYAHQQGYIVNIYTTLRGLTIKSFKKIIENISFKNSKKSRFIIHLPSEDKSEHIPVNQTYLKLLTTIINSKINVSYTYLGDNLSTQVEKLLNQHHLHVHYAKTISRAGNLSLNKIKTPQLKSKQLNCGNYQNSLRGHVILPDGTVVLCCMDYGLKHVLGNLLTHNYTDILNSPELKKVLLGLKNPQANTLCRHCELATSDNQRSKNNHPSKKHLKNKLKLFLFYRVRFLYKFLSNIKYKFIPFKVSDKK